MSTIQKITALVASVAMVLCAVVLVGASSAQAAGVSNGLLSIKNGSTGLSTEDNISNSIATIISWALGFAGAVAVLILVYGGFRYMTSLGDPGQKDQAKNIILYALIGLIVIIVSFVIVSTVNTLFA